MFPGLPLVRTILSSALSKVPALHSGSYFASTSCSGFCRSRSRVGGAPLFPFILSHLTLISRIYTI